MDDIHMKVKGQISTHKLLYILTREKKTTYAPFQNS